MYSNYRYNRRIIFSWSMYDFANSSFSTLVITFVYATYFTKFIAPDEISGTSLWSKGVTLSALIVALLSPVLGTIGDRSGFRKHFLFIATSIAIISTSFLYFILPGQTTLAIICFVLANSAYEIGIVFYNSFLPNIAMPKLIGRISGNAWAFGYVGGLLVMGIAWIGFVSPEVPWFGFTRTAGENIRATTLLTAAWFAVFSLPIFLWVKDSRPRDEQVVPIGVYHQLLSTFYELKKYREIIKFLAARLFYNDGLVTIFAFGGIYAQGTFGFNFNEILIFGIVLHITACLGAFAFGFLDDLLGGKKTIQITLLGLILASLLAVFSPGKRTFWISGILVGIFTGPVQSASRSLMSRFIPFNKETEFFGLFAFSGKATTFLGPLFLGILTENFQSQRIGMGIVIFFFVIGSLILQKVDEQTGIREGQLKPT